MSCCSTNNQRPYPHLRLRIKYRPRFWQEPKPEPGLRLRIKCRPRFWREPRPGPGLKLKRPMPADPPLNPLRPLHLNVLPATLLP